MKNTKGNYPNTFYRVSLKAIIRDNANRVLCVKEKGSDWSLPGGGIDHGESDTDALQRELYEEAGIESSYKSRILGVDSWFVEQKQAYLMWVVYELSFDGELNFRLGEDADEVRFIDPHQLKDSPHRSERLVYKWCVDHSYDALIDPVSAKS